MIELSCFRYAVIDFFLVVVALEVCSWGWVAVLLLASGFVVVESDVVDGHTVRCGGKSIQSGLWVTVLENSNTLSVQVTKNILREDLLTRVGKDWLIVLSC